jgi:outer membrane receptor protein involved in Fe transport
MKRHVVYVIGVSLSLGATAYAQAGDGKPLQLASREPAFYAIVGSHIERAEARNVAALRKHIALRLNDATIPDALTAIEEQTSLRFAFKPSIFPPGATVSLDARDITVAAALTQILLDADVDVELAPYGLASIVARRTPAAAPDTTTGIIMGRVTDSKTHAGVPYVTVSIEGTARSATANDSGLFRLSRVPAGTFKLSAKRVGYIASQRSVTVASGQVTTVDFTLEQSANALDQVVVTGTLVPTAMKSVPTPITIVTDSEIAQQQPRTVNELFRQTVPTAVSFDAFSDPNSTYLSVRGATDLNQGGTRLQTFIDGVEVAHTSETPIDPASIDHIEVIRGPEAAAIYGSGAIDGVLQIFTKHGDPTSGRPSVDAQVAAGDVQTPYAGYRGVLRQAYSGDVRGGTDDASYTVGGGYTQTNNYLPFGNYSAQSTPSVYGGVHYNRGITTIDVSARYHVDNAPSTINPALIAAEPKNPNAYITDPYTSDAFTLTTVGATLGLQPLPEWRNSLTIGYDEDTWNEVQRKPHLTTPTDTELGYAYQDRDKISVRGTSSLTHHFGSAVTGTLIVGADYWSESNVGTSSSGIFNVLGNIQTDKNAPFATSRWVTYNTGLFAQAQVDVFDALFLTAGARLDWDTDFGDSLNAPISPRLGAAYSHSLGFSTIKLRSSWGSAILPPPDGAAARNVAGGGIQLANTHLGPERQHGGDGGFDVLFGRFGSFSATYFNQTAVNLLQQVRLPSSTEILYQVQNVGTVSNTGLELEGTVSYWRASLRLTYGYSRSRIDGLLSGYTGDLRVGDQMLDQPMHTAGAILSFHLWHGSNVAAGLAYVSPWTDYDNITEFECFSNLFNLGSTKGCPTSFVNALNAGGFETRSFFMHYPTLVKGNLNVTQALSPMVSAFVSIDNIGDNQSYEGSNVGPRVGRISTFGLRLHY